MTDLGSSFAVVVISRLTTGDGCVERARLREMAMAGMRRARVRRRTEGMDGILLAYGLVEMNNWITRDSSNASSPPIADLRLIPLRYMAHIFHPMVFYITPRKVLSNVLPLQVTTVPLYPQN